jgi:hypothetical protein
MALWLRQQDIDPPLCGAWQAHDSAGVDDGLSVGWLAAAHYCFCHHI